MLHVAWESPACTSGVDVRELNWLVDRSWRYVKLSAELHTGNVALAFVPCAWP